MFMLVESHGLVQNPQALNHKYVVLPQNVVHAYFNNSNIEYAVFNTETKTLSFHVNDRTVRTLTLDRWIGQGNYTAYYGVRYDTHVFIPILRKNGSYNLVYFIRYDYASNTARWILALNTTTNVITVYTPYVGYDIFVIGYRAGNHSSFKAYNLTKLLQNTTSIIFNYYIQDFTSEAGSVFYDPIRKKPILYSVFNGIIYVNGTTNYFYLRYDDFGLNVYQIQNKLYAGDIFDLSRFTFTHNNILFEIIDDIDEWIFDPGGNYWIFFTFYFDILDPVLSQYFEGVKIRFNNNYVQEIFIPKQDFSQANLTVNYTVNIPLEYLVFFKYFRTVDKNNLEVNNVLYSNIGNIAIYFPLYREAKIYQYSKGVYTYLEVNEILRMLPNTIYSIRGNYVFLKEAYINASITARAFNSLITIINIKNQFKREHIEFTLNNVQLLSVFNITRGFHRLQANYSNPFYVYIIDLKYYKNGSLVESKIIDMNTNEIVIPFDHDFVVITISITIQDQGIIYYREPYAIKVIYVLKPDGEDLTGNLTAILPLAISLLLSLTLGFIIFNKTRNPEGFLLGFGIGIGLLGIAGIIQLGWSVLFIIMIMLYFIYRARGSLT